MVHALRKMDKSDTSQTFKVIKSRNTNLVIISNKVEIRPYRRQMATSLTTSKVQVNQAHTKHHNDYSEHYVQND